MKNKFNLLAAAIALPIVYSSASAQVCGNSVFLGQLSSNPYLADSTANKFGAFGNPYSATSISNPYGAFGNPYSATSVSNPYATAAPKIIAADGQYLGRLSANPYDPRLDLESLRQIRQPVFLDEHQQPLQRLRKPLFADEPEESLCHAGSGFMRR